jgi:hypothetical protein
LKKQRFKCYDGAMARTFERVGFGEVNCDKGCEGEFVVRYGGESAAGMVRVCVNPEAPLAGKLGKKVGDLEGPPLTMVYRRCLRAEQGGRKS